MPQQTPDRLDRLRSLVGGGQETDRLSRLRSMVGGGPSVPDRPTPLRPDHMSAPEGRPLAESDLAAMGELSATPDTAHMRRTPPPDLGGTSRSAGEYLGSAGRSVARMPGRIIEGVGGMVQAAPDVADVLAASRFGFRPFPAPSELGPESGATEAVGEAVKAVGRGVESGGEAMRSGPVRMTQEERTAEMSDPLWWTSRVPEGVAQVGFQAALAALTGGSSALGRGLAFASTSLPLEGGLHYTETRDRLLREDAERRRQHRLTERARGAEPYPRGETGRDTPPGTWTGEPRSEEELRRARATLAQMGPPSEGELPTREQARDRAERQAAMEAAIVGPAAAAVEVGPGAFLTRPLRKAGGPFSNKVAQILGRNLAMSPIEASEEMTQEAIGTGVSYAGGDERAFADFGTRLKEAGAVGGAVGAIAGAGRAGIETAAQTRARAEPEEEGFARAPYEPERRLQGPRDGVQTDEEAVEGGEEGVAPDQQQEGPSRAVRLSGNERGMLVERAAQMHPDHYEAYREEVEARADEFGFEGEQASEHIEALREAGETPELVRVIDRDDRQIEGELRGRETTILTADGRELDAYYAIAPTSAAPSSHDPTTFQQRDPETAPAAKYQDRRYHADRAAQEGVTQRAQNLEPKRLVDPTADPTVGPPIIDPVDDPEAAPELMAQFNDPLTKARDPLSEAQVGARRLVENGEPALRHLNETLGADQTVRQYLDTSAGREFTDQLIQTGVIPQQKAAQFRDDETGLMNAEGRRLVERTLMAAAVGDPDVVDRAPKSHLRNLERALPAIIRTKSVEGWDIAPMLQESLTAAQVARAEDVRPLDLLAQGDLMEGGEGRFSEPAVRMAAFMEEEGPNATARAIRGYAQDAEASANRDLFGDRPSTPTESALRHFGVEQEAEVDAAQPEDEAAGEGGQPFTRPTVDNLRETRRKLAEHRSTRERMLSGEIGRSNLDQLTQEIQDLADQERRLERQLRNMGADPDEVQPESGLQGPDETLAEPAAQGDMFGGPAPAEGGEQFGMGLEGPARQNLSDAERQARQAAERLRPIVEDGEPTLAQLKEYREALGLLNREQGQTVEETRLEARIRQREGEATETGPDQPTLMEPDDAEAMAEGLDPFEAVAEEQQEAVEATDEDAASPIGSRMRGQLARPDDWEGGAVSRAQVRNELAKALEAAGDKVPIRLGRAPTGTRGVFKVRPEVIRVRQAGDLPNAWHETAHALEKLIYGWQEGSPWTSPLLSQKMQTELAGLGRALYGNEKPAGGYRREGFAEFLKMWGTEDPKIEAAPRFREWFEGEFMENHQEVAEQLETAREATRAWREQGAAERARQSIQDPASPSRRLRDAWKRVRQFFSLEEQTEAFQPLYEMAERAEESLGRELEPSENPYILPKALATVESTRTKYMIQRGMIDLAGNRTGGPALKDVADLVNEAELPADYTDFSNREAFTVYLWARRTEALQTDPEGERESGMSLEDATQIIEDLGNERFEAAAGRWYEWNQGVLDYAAEASPTFAEIVSNVRERDPGAYMPLQRVFDDLDDMWSRAASRSPAGPASPVSRLKGSTRDIKDPIQTAIAQAESTMRAAHRRKTLDTIIRLSNVEGLGGLIEEVDREFAPVATRDLQDVINQVRRELEGEAEVEVTGDEGVDLAGRTLTFFAPAQTPSGAEPIVPILDGQTGQVRWFRMDEDVMRSMEALVPHRQETITGIALADEFMKKWARGFRAGTTGLRASFGLVWNMARDPQTMYVNSKSSAAGPRLLVEWLRGMVDVGLNKVTGREAGEWADTYMRLGAEMSQSLGQDIPHTRAAARQLFQGRKIKKLDPRNWFEWYREVVQFPEAAPRIAELKTVAEDIGWEPGEPLSLDQSLQLLMAAKEVTTDFTAAGHFGRKWNQIVPFYNASIQGPRANARAARRNPKKFMLRGLQMTALSLLAWWGYKDEEWWKQMDPREKFLHWHVPMDWPEPTLVRIPRAFEVGLVFGALPEALMDGWYQQDPEAVEEWFDVFGDMAVPPVLPQGAAVAAEQLANENFFFDSPIVPMSLERKPAEEQYNEYTTRLAVQLGDLFNVSPMRIDHAIQGVFGYMGGDLLEAVGMGRPEQDRERELADTPIVGRMFARGGRFGRTKTVDELYDKLEGLQKVQASDEQEETERQRQARLLLSDASDAISALFFLRRHAKSADRRRRLNELITRFADDAVQATENPMELRARFKRVKHEAESREERLQRQTQGEETDEEESRLRGPGTGRSRQRSRRRQR